jgi:AhpC/TSA antioxidant enzyme
MLLALCSTEAESFNIQKHPLAGSIVASNTPMTGTERVTLYASIAVDGVSSLPIEMLRQATVTSVNNEKLRLDDLLGDDSRPAVIVFLRHLGCMFCWSYAKEVCEKVTSDSVRGPYFISIGDSDKLGTFLKLNPALPPAQFFVDSYDRGIYSIMGYGKFTEVEPERAKSVKLTPPRIGGLGEWWKYMANVSKLAPIAPGEKSSGLPDGVLQMGGTLVIRGNIVLYEWKDAVPGDHPNLADVQSAIQKAVEL